MRVKKRRQRENEEVKKWTVDGGMGLRIGG